jgi:hypothetical protein
LNDETPIKFRAAHQRGLNQGARSRPHFREVPALGQLAYFRISLRHRGRTDITDAAMEFLADAEREPSITSKYFTFLSDELLEIARDAVLLAEISARIGGEKGDVRSARRKPAPQRKSKRTPAMTSTTNGRPQ